ncbi:unnamed protein product [Adineta steineri]|uniref:ARID domain-containing protein n=1 Tax=Adineta steineri TaxID=433720 RepID=A0A813Q901_9BILA|nr:unnamed protein product [Adineta steineri]CAF1032399.1 unnamed protein product [Adineta steineri]
MTTFPPIQPRPIVSKPSAPLTTNNIQYSPSPLYLVQSPTVTNNNAYQTHTNLNPNNLPIQNSTVYSTPLSPSDEFLKRLRDFQRGRHTPFRCLPTIGGQVVDLYVLYNLVVSHGGWDKVNDRQLWPTIATNFSMDETCLNGTQALKNIYIRYLYAFEKISHGENIDSHDNDNDDSKRRTISYLTRVPQSYNYAQHTVSETLRIQHGLFNDFVHRNEYEKLELALICGFPNELTFTLNTLLLLSSSSNHTKSFHLYKCPRLLDLLYRHVGLFLSTDTLLNDHYLKTLYDNIWSKHLNYRMDSFWLESCSSSIVKLLLNIDDNDNDTKTNLYKNFNSNLNKYQQEQEFRIEQILMIIRNLSFDRLNAHFLLETLQTTLSLTYRFLLLVSYCENHIELQKYAYDIWTNLALYMHLRMISNDEGLLFRQLLNSMLNGDDDNNQQYDRFKIIRALEIISNLAQAGHDNEIYLMDYIDMIIKSLIHIPDILILVHTLECLYQLSELGVQSCEAILKVQSSSSIIATLIDLLTIEARSFSSQTIKSIKIVEMSSGPVLLPSYHQPPKQPQSVVIIPANQSTQLQQHQQHHSTYTIENSEINKMNPRYIIQQHSKPLTITDAIPQGSILTVTTTSSSPNILPNNNDKKRKHDSISDAIPTVINDALKRSRPYPIPPKSTITISSSSSTNKDENSTEINNTIQSTLTDILDRCSSSFDNDIRLCLNDLCQRVSIIVDQSLSGIFNQLPSPVFNRKIQIQPTKEVNHIDEQLQKKKLDLLPRKQPIINNNNTANIIITSEKKDTVMEQESSDMKPIMSTSNIMITTTSDYICEWDNCRMYFPTARAVFHHVCSVHIKYSTDYICLWNGCDRIKRQKWALISHIQERHCSEIAFRQAKHRLTNPVSSIPTNPTPIPPNISINGNRPLTSGGAVGYASDAAWLAIRRHMQINSFDDPINKSKEGPLTKSIRLTAALILRNIARHSSIGKQNLRQYEQLLANLTLESSEASHILSSCLFELYN